MDKFKKYFMIGLMILSALVLTGAEYSCDIDPLDGEWVINIDDDDNDKDCYGAITCALFPFPGCGDCWGYDD